MTEPNVLGNASGAKFIWETGNTEVINLWSSDEYGGDRSMHHASATTDNGVAYVVPASRILWLVELSTSNVAAGVDLDLQKNTTIDTATGGTTLWKIYNLNADHTYNLGYLKFVATEYVNLTGAGVADFFCMAWGVETDA